MRGALRDRIAALLTQSLWVGLSPLLPHFQMELGLPYSTIAKSAIGCLSSIHHLATQYVAVAPVLHIFEARLHRILNPDEEGRKVCFVVALPPLARCHSLRLTPYLTSPLLNLLLTARPQAPQDGRRRSRQRRAGSA